MLRNNIAFPSALSMRLFPLRRKPRSGREDKHLDHLRGHFIKADENLGGVIDSHLQRDRECRKNKRIGLGGEQGTDKHCPRVFPKVPRLAEIGVRRLYRKTNRSLTNQNPTIEEKVREMMLMNTRSSAHRTYASATRSRQEMALPENVPRPSRTPRGYEISPGEVSW